MEKNLVRDWMRAKPIVIGPRTTLYAAYNLMTTNHIRRLPVVDNGRLVGIVTLGDIREYKPSEATSLSIFDMTNVLSHLIADQVMTHNPITVSPEDTIREAARLMLYHKISGLPVIENEAVVGMITESDIFRVLIQSFRFEPAQIKTVRDHMTPTPFTIGPKTKLPEAHKLMSERRIRRLLVVDDGCLVGIVTSGDVRGAQPSPAASPSIFEMTYLLTMMNIDQIMTSEPVTIKSTATIQEAAALMLARKIGGLPVMDGAQLVGIITESDIFRVMVRELAPAEQKVNQ